MKNKMFSNWSIAILLMSIYAIILAVATIIEAKHGTPFVKETIYGAWWFVVYHILMIIVFLLICYKQKLFKLKCDATMLIHFGFVIVMVGALVTYFWGYEGIMHIRESETSNTIRTKDGEREVPFTVTLKDFRLVRYHGSRTPSSFESDVTINYNGEASEHNIFMNNIARVGGFRLYQTSYDKDEMGTVLTVNSDSYGTNITYFGYIILFVGLFFALIDKRSRFRQLFSKLNRASVILLLFLLSFISYDAQANNIDKEVVKQFGSLMVQSTDGRIEPMNTYSSKILRKLVRENSYNGMGGDELLLSIIQNPYKWLEEPVIYVSDKEVVRELGAEGEYIALAKLFDNEGNYILQEKVTAILQMAVSDRNKKDKEYLKLDEKANILFALLNGDMLPIFPTDHGNWISATDNVDALSSKDSLVVKKTLEWLSLTLREGAKEESLEVLDIIAKYQNGKTKYNIAIDKERQSAEIIYNKLNIFKWSFLSYLIVGVSMLILLIAAPKRRTIANVFALLILAIFIAHTGGMALRWYIAGHAPWTNSYETMVYIAWSTALAGAFFAKREPLVLALSAIMAGVILFVSNLNHMDPQITSLVPVLKSPWLMIHVSVITASYGFFGICALCGITSLIGFITNTAMPKLRIINEMSMIIGLVLLTVGIFLGAVWANESWGRYWGWDPKETWALITMVIYSIVVHSRFIKRLNDDFSFAVMSIFSFLSVLMTFFGVNYYLSGMHSYGSSGEVSLLPVILAFVVLTLLSLWAWKKKQGRN